MLTDTDDDFFFEEDKITNEAIPLDNSTELDRQESSSLSQIVKLTDDVGATVIDSKSAFVNDKCTDFNQQRYELERLGMTVTTKTVVITKDESNLIGISIGGGAPLCPCLYIVQVFDGTPAACEGSLESGDEILAINKISVKGKTKVQVAKMIQSTSQQVTIHYNKLHADPERGKSLDILLKKIKHRIVDSMSSNTADTLGLSRAILCNDSLVKRLEELEGTEMMYKGMVEHARRMLKAYYDLLQTYRQFGDCFLRISNREPQQRASEAFRIFGEFHRNLEKDGLQIIKQIKPVLDDLGTYLNKAIPDTKLTVRRYADAKFTYLSYCLKVKEMDDEEHSYAAAQEPLYRVETGNYEYRLILRCRQDARGKFAKLRTDVLEKMELLECKHATDLNTQLRSILDSLAQLNRSVVERMEALPTLFPIEVDFKDTDFQYKSSTLKPQELDEDDDEEDAEEAQGAASQLPSNKTASEIVCGLEAVEEHATIVNIPTEKEDNNLIPGLDDDPNVAEDTTNNEQLLKDLGLSDIDLTTKPTTINPDRPGTDDSVGKEQNAPTTSYNFDMFLNQGAQLTTQLERDLMAVNALQTDLLLQ